MITTEELVARARSRAVLSASMESATPAPAPPPLPDPPEVTGRSAVCPLCSVLMETTPAAGKKGVPTGVDTFPRHRNPVTPRYDCRQSGERALAMDFHRARLRGAR